MIEADRVWEMVRRRAEATPERVLAVDEFGGRLTCGELCRQAEAVAAGLAADGMAPGDVVAWQLPNRLSTVVLTAALSRLGVVQVPLVPALRRKEVGFICRQSHATWLFVPGVFRGHDHAETARDVARELTGLRVHVTEGALPQADPAGLPPADIAGDPVRWYFYTSGTTADPKGVRHRDGALSASSRTVGRALRVDRTDRVAVLAPLAHIGGISHVVGALRTGAGVILSEVFDPGPTVDLLRAEGVTLVGSGVPFIRAYLARQRAQSEPEPLFPHARAYLSGGAAKFPALHEQVRRELGGRGVISGYGMTECPNLAWCSVEDDDRHLAHSEGRPGPGVEVVVRTADGATARPGEEGELWVRGPQLMVGYVDSSLDRGAFDGEGRFRTGDLGSVDGEGFVTITGRLKDVIIRNMENVSALELENHLITHELVADVAVVGLPDERTGERVCAVVVPRRADRPPTLGALCDHLLAAGMNVRKLPEQLEFADELPRNALGKIVKPVLRERLGALPAR